MIKIFFILIFLFVKICYADSCSNLTGGSGSTCLQPTTVTNQSQPTNYQLLFLGDVPPSGQTIPMCTPGYNPLSIPIATCRMLPGQTTPGYSVQCSPKLVNLPTNNAFYPEGHNVNPSCAEKNNMNGIGCTGVDLRTFAIASSIQFQLSPPSATLQLCGQSTSVSTWGNQYNANIYATCIVFCNPA